MPRKKVTIVGAGMTGGAMAQRLIERDICDVVLQDDPQYAGAMHHGKALDEGQAAAWEGFSARITATDGWEETAGSDVVVITAGAPRKPGQSREELLNNNAAIVRAKAEAAAKYSPNAVIIVFSNPMDAMCHVAMKASGFPRERIIGQGGMLDSARYRYFVAQALGVSPLDVHGYVIGGHTDTTMVPVVSQTRVGGIPLADLLPKEQIDAIVARTMRGGAEIGELYKTGSAYFAPSSATIAMVEAILLDQRRLMPCSVYHQGEYGIHDVFSGTICQL
ncbi:MAG: malate dehydrogenase, partial [Chloroflexota bacterium]|nr:malate dehydrogenase [Dehalococcoidia bacterium]MDW8048031.1 malate dehydrogenase [Chloroflexota bacterium]